MPEFPKGKYGMKFSSYKEMRKAFRSMIRLKKKMKKEISYYLFKRIGTGEKFGAKARTAEEARNIINRRTLAPKYKLKLIKKRNVII